MSCRLKNHTSKLWLLRKGLSKHLEEPSLTNMKRCNLTLESVNHSEKCKREGRFSTACSAADPNLWHRKQMNIRWAETDYVCIWHLRWVDGVAVLIHMILMSSRQFSQTELAIRESLSSLFVFRSLSIYRQIKASPGKAGEWHGSRRRPGQCSRQNLGSWGGLV